MPSEGNSVYSKSLEMRQDAQQKQGRRYSVKL
jgi:hypothetical protein